MKFGILGPLDVVVDGRQLHVGGVRTRLVLAGLLLNAGRSVSVDALVDLVWDDDPPSTARKQIQTVVYQIRCAFGEYAAGLLHTDHGGYRLDVDGSQLDADRFATDVESARGCVSRGDLPGAVEEFRDALRLWRGRPLAGLPGRVVERHATRLEEHRLAAIEECVEVELRLGRHRQLIPELHTLAGQHPLRERITGLLLTALAGDGRRADAIRTYQDRAAMLREELGVEPGPQLRDVYVGTLRDAEKPEPGASAAAPPRCLPRAPLTLVGRRAAVDETTASVRAHVGTGQLQIVAIDGMAGVGKSTVASAIAHTLGDCYPDAHLFIDLRGHSDRAPVTAYEALGVLLTQLRIAEQSIPDSLPGRISLWRSYLTHWRCIIMLDNAASAADVEHLLPNPSGSLVLVTSRRRLAPIHGAWSLSLEPLALSDAVELLRDSSDERVDRETSAAASVVELCGRLPLAIRLAGHRLRHRRRWTVAMMADQLRVADPSPISVAAEGYSTAAAFDVSYRQLTTSERRLFRLLGLHPAGTFEAWPAAALAGLPIEDVRTMLDSLVEVHLVEEDVPGMYRMHDLLRAFAATLVADAEGHTATLRMLDYYLCTAASANQHHHAVVVDEQQLLDADHLARPFDTDAERATWMSANWATLVALADLAHRTGAHVHACLLPQVTLAFALV